MHTATEAQIRAQKRYDAANTRQVHLKLSLRTDKDEDVDDYEEDEWDEEEEEWDEEEEEW